LNLIIAVAALLIGWLGTLAVERFSGRVGLVQAPNERSSHTRPTPSGGGFAIAVALVLAAFAQALLGATELWQIALLVGAIAVLGLVDDLRNLPSLPRFAMQAVVIASLVVVAQPLPSVGLPFGMVLGGAALMVLIVVVGLWWLNLFNFMDGIDGIAGSQASILLVSSMLIWMSVDSQASSSPLFFLSLSGVAATAGFLFRNWPPAKIFMGDAGSYSLALFIFAIALMTISGGRLSYQCWLILTSVFVTDATTTLIRRIARGERPWHAHRQHIYQHLSRRWGHKPVTLAYLLATALWAFPVALVSQHFIDASWLLLLLSYVPLFTISGVLYMNKQTP
jgi:Fuc2NAc and GlcNAc transferase